MDDNNIIDLTVQKIHFDTEEDKAAFGGCRRYRSLFREQVYKLKQNDPNFCLLSARYSLGYQLRDRHLTENVCDRMDSICAEMIYIR